MHIDNDIRKQVEFRHTSPLSLSGARILIRVFERFREPRFDVEAQATLDASKCRILEYILDATAGIQDSEKLEKLVEDETPAGVTQVSQSDILRRATFVPNV